MGKLKRHLDEVVNKTWNFAGRLESPKDHELNAVMGLAAEAGECLDILKKKFYHTAGKDARWDTDLKKELGDVIYYWLKTLDVFGFTIEEILALNREKLESRHPELGKVTERFGKDSIR
jgi:NTP pyrophosphatase (non-canonical NTP hydrolase)